MNPANFVLRVMVAAVAPVAVIASAPTPPENLTAAKQVSGICVQVGVGDANVLAGLTANRGLIIHALERDPIKLHEAQQKLQTRGLYGQVAVEPWPGTALPYADDLVNLLIVEDNNEIPQTEILRVLVPNGAAWLQRATNWASLRKPWPSDF